MKETFAAFVFICPLLLMLFPQHSEALEPDWDLLNQGKVQSAVEPFEAEEEEGVKKQGVALVILPVGIEEAWKVLSDWNSMGEYVPNLKYYRTVYLDDREKFVAGRLYIMFMNIDYPLWIQFDHEQHNHVWRMLRDEELPGVEKRGIEGLQTSHFLINDIRGYFKLNPIDENSTLFFYSTLVSTKIPVPQAVEAYIAKLTLPNFLAAVRQRVIDQRDEIQSENDHHTEETK